MENLTLTTESTKPTYQEWLSQVIVKVENQLECDTSDAQGIVLGNELKVENYYKLNLSPTVAAIQILQ